MPSDVLSVSEAARRLGRTVDYAKGFAEGFGIRLRRVGPCLIMDEESFDRLQAHHSEMHGRELVPSRN